MSWVECFPGRYHVVRIAGYIRLLCTFVSSSEMSFTDSIDSETVKNLELVTNRHNPKSNQTLFGTPYIDLVPVVIGSIIDPLSDAP